MVWCMGIPVHTIDFTCRKGNQCKKRRLVQIIYFLYMQNWTASGCFSRMLPELYHLHWLLSLFPEEFKVLIYKALLQLELPASEKTHLPIHFHPYPEILTSSLARSVAAYCSAVGNLLTIKLTTHTFLPSLWLLPFLMRSTLVSISWWTSWTRYSVLSFME